MHKKRERGSVPAGTEMYVQVVQLCHRESLVLLADEVYQENVYGDSPFVSLRKVQHSQRLLFRLLFGLLSLSLLDCF